MTSGKKYSKILFICPTMWTQQNFSHKVLQPIHNKFSPAIPQLPCSRIFRLFGSLLCVKLPKKAIIALPEPELLWHLQDHCQKHVSEIHPSSIIAPQSLQKMYLSERPAGSLSYSTITIIFVKKHKIYPILQWPKQIIGSTKEAETNLNTTVTGGDVTQGHGNKNS